MAIIRKEHDVKDKVTQFSDGRVKSLDSIRGVAAVAVLVGHVFASYSGFPWWAAFFWNGADAVVIFFLLSGYVLALQIAKRPDLSWSSFMIRRVFRIMPVYVFVTLAAYLAWVILEAHGLVSSLSHGMRVDTSFDVLVMNLFMVGQEKAINPPAWSLYVEMRISLVFLLIATLTTRYSMVVAVFVGLVISILGTFLIHPKLGAIGLDLGVTARFICLFVLGAALAQPGNLAIRLYRRLNLPLKCLLVCIAITLVLYRFWPHTVPARNYVPWIGVSILFTFALFSRRARGWLEIRPLVYLGKISYPVYLSHFPILLLVELLFGNQLGMLGVLSAVFALTLIVSHLFHIWIERPMIVVGQKYAK